VILGLEHYQWWLQPDRFEPQFLKTLLRLSLAEDLKTWTMTISPPYDLEDTSPDEDRHLSLNDLRESSQQLVKLSEEFQAWDGSWVADADHQF
jgi:hypothetical protein